MVKYDPFTLQWILNNEVACVQLFEALTNGLPMCKFQSNLLSLVESCHSHNYRIIVDLPHDATLLTMFSNNLLIDPKTGIHPQSSGIPLHTRDTYIGGPFVTDDIYRGYLKTCDLWGLDKKIDEITGFVPPKGDAHDPESDAIEIALRFDHFLRFADMYPKEPVPDEPVLDEPASDEPAVKKAKIEE